MYYLPHLLVLLLCITLLNNIMLSHLVRHHLNCHFFICALSVGDVGCRILNPVTSVALAVVKNRNIGDLWVYLIGDISGTLAACVMWYVWWPSPEKVDHNNDLPCSRYFSNDEAMWAVEGNDTKASGQYNTPTQSLDD